MVTLADVLAGRHDIYVVCMRCSNFSRFETPYLLALAGGATPIDKVLGRMWCKNCHQRMAMFIAERPSTNPHLLETHRVK